MPATTYLTDRCLAILGILTILILAAGTSYADTSSAPINPGHPLSQTWIDTNLNMSSRNIYTTTGSVGIGMSPFYRLDVNGDVRWSGTLQGGSVPWTRLAGFPAACTAGQFATQVGGTLTCAAAVTSVGTGAGLAGGPVTSTGTVSMKFPSLSCAVGSYMNNFNLDTGAANCLAGITGAGIATQVAFFSGSGSNMASDSNLFWDNTNKRLGIGTSLPARRLHVVGNITVSSDNVPRSDIYWDAANSRLVIKVT